MPQEAWLTEEEKNEIRQVVHEQKLFGYTNDEATQICIKRLQEKFGRRNTLSRRTYEVIKVDEEKRSDATNWITIYSKGEYVANFRDWMLEGIYRKQKMMRLFDELTNESIENQKKNVAKIDRLARSCREETMLQASLGLNAPIILQMKNAIEKGYADEFLPIGQLKRDKESSEDDKRDISTDKYAA